MQKMIDEYFTADAVSPSEMDMLWAKGWRHTGEIFFRFTQMQHHDGVYHVVPLRIRLGDFRKSKHQRRVWNKNQDLRHEIRPICVTDEMQVLFRRHRVRFEHDAPQSLYNFLSFEPATVPCEAVEVAVYDADELVALSFLDLGEMATSSIYGMFHPAYSDRSLGLYTMLLEIEYAQSLGKTWYYHGYCYQEPSFYDYKKRFNALEYFDWKDTWKSLSRGSL
jgi:arginine-tRNA-protein transferase